MRLRYLVMAGLAGTLLATEARAQTADALFGGWSWRPHDLSGRPAGLAGAYVGVADSVRAATVNPAGVALIPHAELAAGVAERWGGIAFSLRGKPTGTPARPTQPGSPISCAAGGPRARPFAVALYAEQALTQRNLVDVVRSPGRAEAGTLDSTSEHIGATIAKGATRWLNLGMSVAWRHLRMDGRTIETAQTSVAPIETRRLSVSGDANKGRAIFGALATFGPPWNPTAIRLGVAYQRDLFGWSVERTVTDRVQGVVASGPTLVRIAEPPVLSAGAAWWLSDRWLFSGQLDYIWYDQVLAALRGNDPAAAGSFRLANGFEPRAAIETTRPSPLGGYLMLRAGIRRETSGRMSYDGPDVGLVQAFRGTPAAFRASVGGSFLAEFYEDAVRFDVDMSQVVVERRSTLSAAGTRRFSIGITVRM